MILFSKFQLGSIELKNRIVMAPMTRCRAIGNVPNELMVEYYRLRADAGLLITEGVAPSINGLGYARMPGIYSEPQIEGWKKITDAVHDKGGHMFMQIMHTGRISHPDNMVEGAEIVGPSAIQSAGEMHTDTKGMQAFPVPKEMTSDDIVQAQQEIVQAAKNAITAGCDGIEIHGANGYLADQFINPCTNQRTDTYGGSLVNRCRFAIEVASKVADAIGPERTGIRLSPYGIFNDMSSFEDLEETYEHLAQEFKKLKLAYIHIVDHSSLGAPEVPDAIKNKIRNAFAGTFIASGSLTKEKAEDILQSNKAELTSFGQLFIANPDLVLRFEKDLELNAIDYDTFYTPDEKGYLDYPLAQS